jgi:hypothetical protein
MKIIIKGSHINMFIKVEIKEKNKNAVMNKRTKKR